MAKRFTVSTRKSGKEDKEQGRSQGAPFIFEPNEEKKGIKWDESEIILIMQWEPEVTAKANPSSEEYMYM